MGRVSEWAHDIGPRRLGFGLAAVGAVYLRFGLALAGYQGGHVPIWIFALTGVAVICAIASSWKVIPFTREAHLFALAHGFFVMMFLFLCWSLPADPGGGFPAHPQASEDFNVFFMPMLSLVWATAALVRRPGERAD